MRIDSGTVAMESGRSYHAASTTIRRFVIRDYQEELAQGDSKLNTAIGGDAKDTQGEEGAVKESGKSAASLQEWQSRFQTARYHVSIRSSVSQTYADIRQHTISYIFDLLFGGRQSRLNRFLEGSGIQLSDGSAGQAGQSRTGQSQTGQSGEMSSAFTEVSGTQLFQSIQVGKSGSSNIKVLNYSQETISIEREDTTFSTVGTVKTADGREIHFNVNVGMSREFQEYYRDDLNLASFRMCDPLVINLDTDIAELSDQTFYFDIDGDGEKDEIAQLKSGSGYLALDQNGDGVINDGSELFGTASGNGFADLAKYDEDGNGWIDEGDSIWGKLKIWAKDENGEDVLYRLSEKGVGAICLQNVSTDFTQKGQDGKTLGAIRNSGVFLYENGNVGTVQHVDVAKYDKEA